MIEILGRKMNLTKLGSIFMIIVGSIVIMLQLAYSTFLQIPFITMNSIIGMIVFIYGCYLFKTSS